MGCCSLTNRHRELKESATGRICLRPEPSSVSFDNRTADGQPHVQPLGLRRMKGVEKAIKTLRIQPWARISDGKQYVGPFSWAMISFLTANQTLRTWLLFPPGRTFRPCVPKSDRSLRDNCLTRHETTSDRTPYVDRLWAARERAGNPVG